MPLRSPLKNSSVRAIGGMDLTDVLFLFFSLAIAATQLLLIGNNLTYPDGIAYLDVGEMYFFGGSHHPINAYWSFLYSFILGFIQKWARPPIDFEFWTISAFNFFTLVMTAIVFVFLMRVLIQWWRGLFPATEKFCFYTKLFGYFLFAWTTFKATPVDLPTPDLLVSFFVYLAVLLLLWIASGRKSIFWPILLGIVLGFGFLTKPIMLFITAAFTIIFLLDRQFSFFKRVIRVAILLLVFSSVLFPYVYSISKQSGKFSMGTTGAANYAWFVGGAHKIPIIHEKLLSKPCNVFEFQVPPTVKRRVTFPWHYDPSWQNPTVTFNLRKQLGALARNCQFLSSYFFFPYSLPILSLVFFVPAGFLVKRLRSVLPIFLLSAAGTLPYLFLLVEGRYMAPFAALFYIGIFLLLAQMDTASQKKAFLAAMAVFIFLTTASLSKNWVKLFLPRADQQLQTDTAKKIQEMGIEPGSKVAYCGKNIYLQYWARLARVEIAAQIYPCANPKVNDSVLNVMRSKNIRIIVSNRRVPALGEQAPETSGQTKQYWIYTV